MTVLLGLVTLLLLAQWRCARRVRRDLDRLMRPGAELEPDDVDRWLALIEPFPLPERPREQWR